MLQRCSNLIVTVYLYLEIYDICRPGDLGSLWDVVIGFSHATEGADRSDKVSGNDRYLYDEISFGSLTNFGLS